MRRLPSGLFLPGLVSVLALSWAPESARSQEAQPEPVKFDTADRVEISGTFYPNSKRNKAPCVLLLHALGEDSSRPGWKKLAQEFQAKGFAVLCFDFRGHGDSKKVQPNEFFKYRPNLGAVRAVVKGKPPTEIHHKDFNKAYYPVLVNDIAAAKAFLDRRNDAGECNSANLIVVGADTGATLGAVWVNAEWHRYLVTRPAPARGFLHQTDSNPEGKGITAAIWLSIQPTLGNRKLSVAKLLDVAGRQNKVPMAFLYGEKDVAAKDVAKNCYAFLVGKQKMPLTFEYGIKGSEKLAGRELLANSLATQSAIVKYAGDVVKASRAYEWKKRDLENNLFVWQQVLPGGRVLGQRLASMLRSETLAFDTYNAFIPR